MEVLKPIPENKKKLILVFTVILKDMAVAAPQLQELC